MAKLLIEARGVKVSYSDRLVLDIDRFELYDGDRVGLVGENGAGKSTLLGVLTGRRQPDEGIVRRLCQASEILQMGDCARDKNDIDKKTASEFSVRDYSDGLSGGERTRRRIAGALTDDSHALFADEPTVDLDASGVKALEKRLLAYEGAVVLVSHDRSLLDSVCTRICELADGRITSYAGNYSAYRAERERRKQFEKSEYDAYVQEKARLKKLIQQEVEHASKKQHLPKRMGNSEARLHKREVTNVQGKIHQVRKGFESRLERLDEKTRPREEASIRMALGESSGIIGKTAISVSNLNVRFGDRTLFNNARADFPTRSKTALLGDNGTGKTTLIRRILAGEATVNPGVRIGYFGQEHEEVLDMDLTALENVMKTSVHSESVARTVLARLNIRLDDVFKRARVLSGGERAKVCMARLFVSDANLLILDEPTNHLDIWSMEALESVLTEYAGTLIFVSHDSAFVKSIADRLVFIENARLRAFEGGVSEYEEYVESTERGRRAEDYMLKITSLEMRLAGIAARMAKPRKGDSPERLNAEYEEAAKDLRDMKAEAESQK